MANYDKNLSNDEIEDIVFRTMRTLSVLTSAQRIAVRSKNAEELLEWAT